MGANGRLSITPFNSCKASHYMSPVLNLTYREFLESRQLVCVSWKKGGQEEEGWKKDREREGKCELERENKSEQGSIPFVRILLECSLQVLFAEFLQVQIFVSKLCELKFPKLLTLRKILLGLRKSHRSHLSHCGFTYFCVYVLVSCCHCKNLSQTVCPKRAHIYSPRVLEIRSLESVTLS